MKLFGLKFSNKKNPAARGNFFLAPELLLWLLFVGVVAVEGITLYNSVYQALFAAPSALPDAAKTGVRINFENYQKVITRLDEVKLFHSTSTINFFGPAPSTGRSNPFLDPE